MWEFLFAAVSIFFLRLADITLYTIRLMMVVRGRKALAMFFAFCQSLIFITVMREVFSDTGNWGKIVGYSAGFATGLVLGMAVENRLAIGYSLISIISPARGAELVERLRGAGFAVTEVAAKGRDGMVSQLNCIIRRKESGRLEKIVIEIDPEAFITAKYVRSVMHGFWQRSSSKIW